MTASLKHLRSRLRRAASLLPFLPRTLRLVWRASPRWTAAWGVLLIVQGVLPAATVLLTRDLVDSLAQVVDSGGGWPVLRPALLPALLLGLVLLLAQALRGLSRWVRTAQSELVQDHLADRVHAQSLAVDLAFYDLPDYFDRLHRARSDAAYRPPVLLENLGSLLQNTITLGAMLLVLLPYGLILPLALALGTLPAVFVVLHYTLRHYRFRLRTTADERRAWYYNWLLTARESAAEIRLFDLGSHFQKAYQALRQRLRHERLALLRGQAGAELAAGLAGLLVAAVAGVWMLWRTLQGQASLGDLALVYAAFSQGQGLLRALLENVGQIYANSLFLEDLFDFLALRPHVAEPATPTPLPRRPPVANGDAAPDLPAQIGVRFVDVTFSYPGHRRAILHDFNLDVPPGQITAVVGSNGAGKSTLVKLLCRFYDPQAGHIAVNGVDLRSLSLAAWRRQMTVLFQTPLQYNATVAQNIRLGDLARAPDRADVQEAARQAGADHVVDRLPQRWDTLLGVWFSGGTDLSVGEWQRLALARAYLRQAPLIVLDEPTSAMDPWAEADWLTRFRRLAVGHTALIITHRFSTARYADIIHVMENGRIIESGAHAELLALCGRYAVAWHAQKDGATA